MDCHPEPIKEHYWDTSIRSPHHKALYIAIGKTRQEQINRFFHIWEPIDPGSGSGSSSSLSSISLASPDQKAECVASYLRISFARYWRPSTHIAVDECIEPFFGRSSDTVNIPTKPNPVGFKIQYLADDGYVIDFLWHQKGALADQGPQGLRQDWQDFGFTKTQSVVLELVLRIRD